LIAKGRHLAWSAGWIVLLLPLSAVLLSVALSPASNWIVRTAVAGFCLLAIVRPDAALLIAIALVGFGTILSHMAGAPALRVNEVLVVGSIAGCFVRAVPRNSPYRAALSASTSVPAVLFALSVLASLLVWLRVYQIQTTYPLDYLQLFVRFLTRDYFVQPGNFAVVVTGAAILEGLALFVVIGALCKLDETFFHRAARMLVIGGVGLAMMSLVRLGEILLRSPGAIDTLRASAAGLRISPQIADYIAAGSYFSLCWLVALGLAIARSRRRLLWAIGSLPLIAALYLTGSRSVIAAALAGLVALGLLAIRQRMPAVRGLIVFAVLTVVAMVLSYQWMIGRDVAGTLARQSLTIRAEIVRAGLHVAATRPVFGIGLDRFFLVAGDHASPELRALWHGRLNPHNDFLRFAAELGLVGFALFVWIVGRASARIWRGLQRTRDPQLAGVAAGLVAFLVTSLVSNPLMVREVSYVFWIALGLGVGHTASASMLPGPRRLARKPLALVTILATVIVSSIPFRAQHEVASTDLTHVTYGLFAWGQEPDGTLSRWSGPRARFYVDGRTRYIEIPLNGVEPSGQRQHVEIMVDGRLVNRVTVGSEWQRVRTLMPDESSPGPRRIDLVVSPSWIPAEVIPGNQDRRELGVKVGVVKAGGMVSRLKRICRSVVPLV
jgi:O-antigen ligase